VGAPVPGHPVLQGLVADELHAVVDAEVLRLLLVAGPFRAVADDHRRPVPLAQLGQRQQHALEVRVGVQRPRVDDVRVAERRQVPHERHVDALGHDGHPVAVAAEFADPRLDDAGGDDDSVRPPEGEPPRPLAAREPLVAVPVDGQREPPEDAGDLRAQHLGGRDVPGVDDLRPVAQQQHREHQGEQPGCRVRFGDGDVADVPLRLLVLVAVPPPRAEQRHLVAALAEQPRCPAQSFGGFPARFGGLLRHDGHAHMDVHRPGAVKTVLIPRPVASGPRRPSGCSVGRATTGPQWSGNRRSSTVGQPDDKGLSSGPRWCGMSGYDIERYLNARNASGGTFSPDGERLAFLLDTTGVTQLWSLDEPGCWPAQRTFYEERVTFADFSPTRDELAFGMDEGGDERMQLFRVDADGERVRPLTDVPDAKHRWGGWSHDGDRFAFTSNRRDQSVFDVYVQHRDEQGDDATLVHEGGGWLSVAGWSPDDDRLLVHEARSNFDQDLHVLHLDSGDLEHLTPHEETARYNSPGWGPDGEAVYTCTDRDADTLSLARLDVESGDLETVVDGGQWNVDGVAVDQESGRLVYSRNVDGYTELQPAVFEAPTELRQFPVPDLPEGVAGGVDFGPDGEVFSVTATSRSMNANVYVVDVETGAAERWTDASTAGIPRETLVDPTLVHYETFDGREIPAFFSLPQGVDEDDEVPVVVSIHGGPEGQRRPSFHAVSQYFLNSGYAFFEPNVRGSTGYGKAFTHLDDVRKRMDSVRDLRAGVDWLHDRSVVDPDRVVAMGGSYGGFMVLAALTEYPDLWAAGVDVVGIANFVTFLENTGDWRRELREAEYGSLDDDREFLEEISPINGIERIAAPLFVAHGANDPRVPVGEAEQVAEEAAAQGVPVETLVFEDEGHGFSKLENRIEAYSRIVDFLDEHA
jgi:dipeptidyl aminopeptidase/acylaminoacyl peptidase